MLQSWNDIPTAVSCPLFMCVSFGGTPSPPLRLRHLCLQVGGVRSNLWPGAVCAGKGKLFTNVYVGWGLKNAPFQPLPPPALAFEFGEALVESNELPPPPQPPAPEEEDE